MASPPQDPSAVGSAEDPSAAGSPAQETLESAIDDHAPTAAEVAADVVARGVAPCAAAGCAARCASTRRARDTRRASGRPSTQVAAGAWARETGGAAELYFDLASVTKPMTAVAVARSGIDRRTPLGALLDEARGTPSEHASLEQLLAHRAGLEAHVELYRPLLANDRVDPSLALGSAARARRPDAAGPLPPEGFDPVYSDVGYALAGAALARATGLRDAGEAIERFVLDPLGAGVRAGTVRTLAERGIRGPFAATEDVSWRGGSVAGAVHDENAWALTGLGGSGHAGVFATVDAVLAFGVAFLDALEGRPSPLGGVPLDWIVRPRSGGTLRAGFDGKSPTGSSAGDRFGPGSFGHLGFTGTSLWIDPDASCVVALLTNRVCPTRANLAIRAARPIAHDALWRRARRLCP